MFATISLKKGVVRLNFQQSQRSNNESENKKYI